ncbi:MAG: TetR family transcriptional regulator, partial [Myxococcota bacterium]
MRASIIENAIGLFREQGFEATTVRGISLACEMSEATFFRSEEHT